MAGQTRDGGALSQPRRGDAVRAPDGAILLIGGRDRDGEDIRYVERFDPVTESWSVLDGPETSVSPSVAEVGDASLLLVGGSDSDGSSVSSAQRYDADTVVLQEASSSHHAYRYPELVPLDDGGVLVLEGENEGEFDEAVGRIYGEVYGPSDEWSPVEPLELNTRIDRVSATQLPDGQILVLFSHRELDDGVETPINATSWAWLNQITAALYDLEDNQWTELGTFEEAYGGLRPDITWLPEKEKYLLHLLGDSMDWTFGYLFDPKDKEWEFLYERRPIPGWVVEVLPGDQVLFRFSERFELYDATTNSWSEFDVIPETIRFSSIKLLPDCRLFFSGARVVGGDPMEEPEMHTAFCTPE